MKKIYFDGWVWEIVSEYNPEYNGMHSDVYNFFDSFNLKRKVNGKWLYIDKVKTTDCYLMREEEE